VRRAAKVLKKKDPEQLSPCFCQPLVRCAPKNSRGEKNPRAQRKTDQPNNSTLGNFLATANSNKLRSFSAKL
jgi:hypothetical protein